MSEFTFTIDWSVWIPIIIALMSLLLSVYQFKRRINQDDLHSLEQKIDDAYAALKRCEASLEQCEHEKDELRQEKFVLLEQIAKHHRNEART